MSLYFLKDSGETLDFTFNWSEQLQETEVISSSSMLVSPPGIVITSQTFTDTSATLFLEGGADGATYTVTNHITTSFGRSDEAEMFVEVEDEAIPEPTLGSMADEVVSRLQGDTSKVDSIAALSAPLTSASTVIALDDTTDFSRGIIEIGSELILVKSVDHSTSTLQVRMRGYRGTRATTHDVGELVTMSPLVPRAVVLQALSDEIAGSYPALFATERMTFTTDGSVAYELPVEADSVLSVRRRTRTLPTQWVEVTHWTVQRGLLDDAFPTGVALALGASVADDMQVVLGRRPNSMGGENDPYSACGLPPSCRDLNVLGAAIRLLPSFDISRLGYQTASGAEGNKSVQPGASGLIVRELKAQYAARLAQEQLALKQAYPSRQHFLI